MYESEDVMVSHPNHYQGKDGLEVIDVIECFTDGLMGVEATDTGNIIKYACRWKRKNGIQDLEKIIWYATHLKEYLIKNKKDENHILASEKSLSMDIMEVANAFTTEHDFREKHRTTNIIIAAWGWKRTTETDHTYTYPIDILDTIINEATDLINHLKEKENK